jgi:aromatic-L-amino-acid/L-tryptophan decarboxylase
MMPTRSLTLDTAERRRLLEHVSGLVDDFLEDVEGLPVAPDVDPQAIREALAEYDFAAPREAHAVFDDCVRWLRRWMVHVTHPRYFGLFNPRPTTACIAADLLVAALNPQLATWSHSPAPVEIERHVIAYMGDRLGLQGGPIAGSFTTGGAEANHTGVLLALTRAFPAYVSSGARALPGQPLVYASTEAHTVLIRIAQACGLGRNALRSVPTDEQLRLDAGALAALVEADRARGALPFLVVATAGTTTGGIIDPLPASARPSSSTRRTCRRPEPAPIPSRSRCSGRAASSGSSSSPHSPSPGGPDSRPRSRRRRTWATICARARGNTSGRWSIEPPCRSCA